MMSAGLLIKTFGEVDAKGRDMLSSGTITSLECGNYYIPGPPVPMSIVLDSTTGLKITTLADSLPPGVPKPAVPFPVEINDIHKTDKRDTGGKIRINKDRIDGEKAPRRPAPYVVHLRRLKDGLYEQTGTIKLPKRRQCQVIFRDTDSDVILRPQFPDSIKESWWMHSAGDSAVFLTPQDTGKVILEGILDGRLLILRIEVSDAWILDGIFRYTDPFGNLDNRLSMTTLFFYLKDYQGQWEYWISDYTDANGYFATMIFDADVLVQAVSENIQCFVFRTDGELGPGSEPAYYHGFAVSVEGNIDFEDITIPAQYTTIGQQYWNIGGAFNICNVIRNGYSNFGYDFPYQVPVYHDNSDASILSSSYGGVSLNGVRGIIIQGSAPSGNNWDQWDSSIVLHEYGHAFMDQNAQLPPTTQNEHYYYMPTYGSSVLNLAYAEGWADFFAGVANNTHFLTDHNEQMQWLYIINLEQPYPDVPFASSLNPDGPPSPTAIYEGAHVEGAISEALWDIFDETNDANYYLGGVLWGHNDDQNQYYSWQGLSNIVYVLWGFDPKPDDPEHDYCWNVYEFIHGWRKMGYSTGEVFKNIFEAHGIPIFIPGDVNDNGIVNILDITGLVAYLYKGATVQHPSACDVTGDCTSNILDVSYLTAFLYKGGDEPLAGCVNLYP
jgi:hypothetical protein